MAARLLAGALLASLVVAATGCGSGGGGSKFTLEATQKCLDDAGLQATRDHNTVLAGSGGNLKVDFGYGSPVVYVVFGKDGAEAQALENRAVDAARRYNSVRREVVLAGVERNENVFVYSNAGPLTGVGRSKVDACLK